MDEKGVTHITEALTPEVTAGDAPERRTQPKYLILLAGGTPGAMLELQPGPNWIGRAADNSMQFPEPTVSRHHAVVRVEESGQVQISDLFSTNGTFVNGRRLTPNQAVTLRDGDRIQIGTKVLVKHVCPDPFEERFQREMFERGVRDGLTGLYNRAYFLEQLGPLFARASERGLGLAVVLLDVDHFKRVNDQLGHDAGDAVLQGVAGVLRMATRPDDLVARYGGEEFILALPANSAAAAAGRAERLRRALGERALVRKYPDLRVTASIGIAFTPPDRPLAASQLITRADLFLYRAKERGRNQVIWEPEDGSAEVAAQVTTEAETGGMSQFWGMMAAAQERAEVGATGN